MIIMKPYILGVSGVIGSGKSTFCELLVKKAGYFWINTDMVTHHLYLAGNQGYKKIKDYFGDEFVNKKEVQRNRLRKLIIKSPQKIFILNRLMHSVVSHEVSKKVVRIVNGNKNGKSRICIESAYFEQDGLGDLISKFVFLDCEDKIALRRVGKRKLPSKEIKLLLEFQRKYIKFKGERVPNNGSKAALYAKMRANGYINA